MPKGFSRSLTWFKVALLLGGSVGGGHAELGQLPHGAGLR